MDRLLQRFIDQRLVAAFARLRFEVLDHRAVEKDVHALLVRQHRTACASLAQHQFACGDVGAPERLVALQIS